jgi:hypothetical protein
VALRHGTSVNFVHTGFEFPVAAILTVAMITAAPGRSKLAAVIPAKVLGLAVSHGAVVPPVAGAPSFQCVTCSA